MTNSNFGLIEFTLMEFSLGNWVHLVVLLKVQAELETVSSRIVMRLVI